MEPFRLIPALEIGNDEKITALAVGASVVFVGTDKGVVLKCSVPKPSEEDTHVKGELKARVQLASKKPIQTLALIENISLLAALSDGCVHLLPFSLSAPGHVLVKSVSALCASEGESLLYVGRRGSIGVYVHQNLDFQLLKELSLNSNKEVRKLKALPKRLVVATQQEYFIGNPDTGCFQEVFGIRTGDTASALILPLSASEVLLAGQGNLGIVFCLDTFSPAQKNTFGIPQDVIAATVSEPYVISAGLSGCLYLYNLATQTPAAPLSLALPSIAATAAFQGETDEPSERIPVIIAAANTLKILLPVPFKHHLHKLLLAGRVADALEELNANFPLKNPQRNGALRQFHLLAGWSRFASLNFPVAFQHFAHAPVDLGQLLGFWRRLWPSWLQLPLLEETKKIITTTPPALFPQPQELQDFVAGVLAASDASSSDAQSKAKQQVLLELASSALCSFLLKQRLLLLSDYNGFCKFNISSSSSSNSSRSSSILDGGSSGGAAAPVAAAERRQQQQLLLKAVDTILVKLLVESDDPRWQQMLLPPPAPPQPQPQPPQQQQYLGCTCSVEDCRVFLLSIHRTDALAALLQHCGRTEEALELLSQQLKDSTRAGLKAATALPPAEQILQLLQQVLHQQQQQKQQQRQQQPRQQQQDNHEQQAAALLRRFAPLVLPTNPKETIELFMQKGFCPLPPVEVLQLLQQVQQQQQEQQLRETFLEHLLLQGLLQDPQIETELAGIYLDRTLAAAKEATTAAAAAAAASPRAAAKAAAKAAAAKAAEEEERKRLRRFLQQQFSYDVAALLAKAAGSDLVEERATLHGKAGEHERALLCFVRERNDVAAAEAYCVAAEEQLLPLLQRLQQTEFLELKASDKLWCISTAKAQQQQQQQQDQQQQRQQGYLGTARRSCGLLLLLLKVLLDCWREASAASAPAATTATAAAEIVTPADFYLKNALLLLQRHAGDPALSLRSVFDMLPSDLPLQQVAVFIRVSLQQQQDAAATAAVQEKLCSAEYLTVYGQAAEEKCKWIEITQETACPSCARRIGNRAFVADPEGKCFHVQCAENMQIFTATPSSMTGSPPTK